MEENVIDPITRRNVFRWGGGVAAGLALGGAAGAMGPGAVAAPRQNGMGALSLPVSQSFDLNDPGGIVIQNRAPWCETIMQSAGYDHLNEHWYVAQVMYNPDDGVPFSTRQREGDIAITKLSANGSVKLGRMYLRGFGHAAQIGIETTVAGSPPYIWIEYDSVANADNVGFGTKLCRIKYMGPATGQPPRSFHWDNAADRTAMNFRDRTPNPAQLPGAGSTISAPRPFVDMHNRRVMVRFGRNGTTQTAVWGLDAAVANPLGTPLHHVASLPKPTPAYTSQGFSFYGSFMYMYEGSKYASGGPTDPTDLGNTHITKVDLNTGAWERKHIRAMPSLTIREPEGMSIRLVPDATGVGGYRPQLCFGFGSGPSNDHRVNIAYKDIMI